MACFAYGDGARGRTPHQFRAKLASRAMLDLANASTSRRYWLSHPSAGEASFDSVVGRRVVYTGAMPWLWPVNGVLVWGGASKPTQQTMYIGLYRSGYAAGTTTCAFPPSPNETQAACADAMLQVHVFVPCATRWRQTANLCHCRCYNYCHRHCRCHSYTSSYSRCLCLPAADYDPADVCRPLSGTFYNPVAHTVSACSPPPLPLSGHHPDAASVDGPRRHVVAARFSLQWERVFFWERAWLP